MTRAAATTLQINLNLALKDQSGFTPIGMDGAIGNQTKKAVAQFQSLYNLPADGDYNNSAFLSLLDNKAMDVLNAPVTNDNLSAKYKYGNRNVVITEAFKKGVSNRREFSMLLAQLDHESTGFTRLEENLHYSANTLYSVFKKYFTSLSDAQAVVAQGPKAIANRIYGGRMGNGSDNDDGYNYRGRSFIQLTGKDNYTLYQDRTGLPLVSNPDLASIVSNAAIVSLAYWFETSGLREAGQAGDVNRATRIINGGYTGLDQRVSLYNNYLVTI